jgi:hypothetical protein
LHALAAIQRPDKRRLAGELQQKSTSVSPLSQKTGCAGGAIYEPVTGAEGGNELTQEQGQQVITLLTDQNERIAAVGMLTSQVCFWVAVVSWMLLYVVYLLAAQRR